MSDLHIVLDHVQFEKGSYVNRTRIQQPDGRLMWLTIPVEKGKPINETRIDNTKLWRIKHSRALEQLGIDFYPANGDLLADVLEGCWMLQGNKGWQHCTCMDFPKVPGKGSELILNLCKETGATTYLSGPQGRNYLDVPAFEQAGIHITYHDYEPPNPPVSAICALASRA